MYIYIYIYNLNNRGFKRFKLSNCVFFWKMKRSNEVEDFKHLEHVERFYTFY